MCVFIYMKLYFTSRGLFILLAERSVRFVLNNILIYTLIYSINKILKINKIQVRFALSFSTGMSKIIYLSIVSIFFFFISLHFTNDPSFSISRKFKRDLAICPFPSIRDGAKPRLSLSLGSNYNSCELLPCNVVSYSISSVPPWPRR